MGLLNINNGVSQEKGITYTVIIDDISNDFGDVGNNTYFLDKQTQLVYYKNSTGDLVSIYEQGGSDITSSAGAGLTYNTTTNKIDLGGVLDNGTPANNIYFIPSVGANAIRWGISGDSATGNHKVAANAAGSSHYYISHFDYWTFVGYYHVIGLFGQGAYGYGSGPQLGCLEHQGSTSYLKMYKDVTQMSNADGSLQGFPGGSNALLTFHESDSSTQKLLQIWESSGSNTNSKITQTFDKFESLVGNAAGHSARHRITSGYVDILIPNADNSQHAMFLMMPGALYWKDGQGLGITTVPDGTWIGGVATSGSTESRLVIGLGTTDSYFFTGSNSNNRGIKYKGFGETDTETGVDADYTTLVGTSLVPKKYVDDVISGIYTIYSADDSLTDNRIVDLDNNSLTFEKGTVEIKGAGITTDTTLALYNGDVTPSKTWEWLDNGNVNINQTSTLSLSENKTLKIDGSSNTLENIFELNGGTNAFGTGVVTVGSYGNVEIKGTNPNSNFKVFTMLGNEQFTLDGNGNNSTLRTKAFDIGTSTTTGYKIYEDSGRHEFVRLGIMGANFNLVNSDILFWEAGIDNKTFVVGGSTPIETEEISLQGNTLISEKLELSSKEHGILLNRVDSSEMFAISAEPDEIVHNTELNALYRWDNNLNTWVAISAGYGIISINDSSGIPNYYATLSAAFANASSGDVITLHSDITSTSQCIMPGADNATLNINGNGHTITHTSNTGSEFILISSGSGNNKILYLNDVKIVSNGTSNSSTSSAIISSNPGSGGIESIRANSGTFVSSINNSCSYLADIIGGTWTSSAGYVGFSSNIRNAKITTKSGRGNFINCDITIVSGGQIGLLGDLIDCNITGDATGGQSMIYSKVNQKIHGCTITCTSGGSQAIAVAGGVTWTTANPTPIKDTKIYYYGTHSYAVAATYIVSIKDVYIYSDTTTCLYAQNTTQTGGYNLENVVLETNSTNKAAFYRLDSGIAFRMKNVSATNLNSTNTEEAFDIRVSGASELYMEGCSANVNNASIDNIKLINSSITTGGAYIYGLIMSKIGTGLNLNTVPLLNTNTSDDYGNLKIG